jgi:hypothetical protein
MENLLQNVDYAFFFVVDLIISIQRNFIFFAREIGRIVLLIAILSAALNYALTGTGLKENIIKIAKATIFFLIIISIYPRVIGGISTLAMNMAEQSLYPHIRDYFRQVTDTVWETVEHRIVVGQQHVTVDFFQGTTETRNVYRIFTGLVGRNVTRDREGLFGNFSTTRRNNPQMSYTVFAPAAVFNVIFLLAGECFDFANSTSRQFRVFPEFSRILIGLICAFFIILTGIFALLEYLVCFLEFMLVSTVGVILFPLIIWEGSKPWADKYISAIIGFFIKLLFCSIAILLLIYGFISLHAEIFLSGGFQGKIDQIVFIVFVCLLFFLICKSAPSLAQSLLTGSPSLSGTGAISAVGGAIAAAGATMGIARSAGRTVGGAGGAVAGGLVRGGAGMIGTISEASAASGAVRSMGGGRLHQAGAFLSSIGSDAGRLAKAGSLGLTRSLLGAKNAGSNPYSYRERFINARDNEGVGQTFSQHLGERNQDGVTRGNKYAEAHGLKKTHNK